MWVKRYNHCSIHVDVITPYFEILFDFLSGADMNAMPFVPVFYFLLRKFLIKGRAEGVKMIHRRYSRVCVCVCVCVCARHVGGNGRGRTSLPHVV